MNKKELYILLAIIVVLLSYIIFRPNESLNYKIPKINKIEETTMEKISYMEMTLSKSGDEWLLPSGYNVSSTVIKRILSSLKEIKVIDMISSSKDFERYGLSELHPLTVMGNDIELLKIYIGNTSSTGNYTYIKLENRDEVYSVRGDLTTLIPQTEEELRDKTVFSYDHATDMIINIGEEEFILTGEELENNKLYISNLQASTFNELPRENVIITVSVKAEQDHTLIIYEKVENEYPATSSDVPYPFTLPTYVVERVLELQNQE